jgi:hypothetical protein
LVAKSYQDDPETAHDAAIAVMLIEEITGSTKRDLPDAESELPTDSVFAEWEVESASRFALLNALSQAESAALRKSDGFSRAEAQPRITELEGLTASE